MSSTPSLPSKRRAAAYAAVAGLVAERAGRGWCLFVDRDGVLNRQIAGDYVRHWQEFEWLPGARLALKQLRQWAPALVIVTNQQGVGKGLMTAADLTTIHLKLEEDLAEDDVVLDGIQVCPHLARMDCECRKPRAGLVLNWLELHPDCESELSIVVGDSEGDLGLARNVSAATGGCASIWIGDAGLKGTANASFDSIWDFAVAVAEARGDE